MIRLKNIKAGKEIIEVSNQEAISLLKLGGYIIIEDNTGIINV